MDELCLSISAYRAHRKTDAAHDIRHCVHAAGAHAFSPERLLTDAGCIAHVATLEDLNMCSRMLSSSSVLALDMERNWFRSYKGKTTLIQIASAVDGGKVFVVDCLQLSRDSIYAHLRPVLECPTVLKVFHAARNDMKWLFQEFGISVSPVLDTQVLASSIGSPHCELTRQWALFANLHAEREVKRRLQKSDWQRRPLLPLQAKYAAADAYLLLRVAGGLLRICEHLRLPQCELGWPPELAAPPLQHLLNGSGVDSAPAASRSEWRPARELAEACQVVPGLRLWEELAKASRAPALSGERAEEGRDHGGGLRQVARRLAPSMCLAHLDALGEWRRQLAEAVDESPHYLLPDELLVRAAAARSRAEAEAVVQERVASLSHDDTLSGLLPDDEPQVPCEAHLQDAGGATNDLLDLLDMIRAGQPLPARLEIASGSHRHMARNVHGRVVSASFKWWLPYVSADEFQLTLQKLPPEQQRRVLQEPLRKQARYLTFILRVAAKGPVYENCTILAPDGQVLCTVDSKKLRWYVRRGLGEYTDESTTTVKLRFEPQGRFGIPADGRVPEATARRDEEEELQQRELFYTSFKYNRCVLCASAENLARYNVVPSCFRRHLPASHQPGSHDVLLLCVPCHQRASLQHGQGLRCRLAARVGLGAKREDFGRREPRKAARASALGLLKGGDLVPEERIAVVFGRVLEIWRDARAEGPEFEAFAAEFRGRAPEAHRALLRHAPRALEILWLAARWTPEVRKAQKDDWWERQVIELWMGEDDLAGLLQECRAYFVDAMRPKYLPEHWDIRHRVSSRGPLAGAQQRL